MKELALTINGTPILQPANVPVGDQNTISSIFRTGITFLFVAAILITLAFLIWGGLDYMWSEGKKDKIERARKKLTYAIIGLIVVFAAFLIVSAIGAVLNVSFF